MAETAESIEVNAPLKQVYDQWTQFEDFPRFMEGVVEVRQIDDRRLLWRAEMGGTERAWQAEIVDQLPERRITWRAVSGAETGGAVHFKPLPGARTEVTLGMRYYPEGFAETYAEALRFVTRRVQGDLRRFARFMEERAKAKAARLFELDREQVGV